MKSRIERLNAWLFPNNMPVTIYIIVSLTGLLMICGLFYFFGWTWPTFVGIGCSWVANLLAYTYCMFLDLDTRIKNMR